MKNYYKYIIVGLFGIIAAFVLSIYFATSEKSEVEIRVAPADANITINGKTYKNGTYTLPNGEAKIHIDFGADFVAQDYSINIPAKAGEVTKIYTFLLQRDGSTSWYDSHESDAILMNTIGDYLAEQEAKSYLDQHPIASELPIIIASYDENYNYTEYRIDGGHFTQCEANFCLKITDVTGNNFENAKEKIKNIGFNPADFEIIYEFTPIQPL